MSVVYEEKISFNVHLHCQMSVKTSKYPFLRTFDRELYVYHIEMQFYGHMSLKHLFIAQAPGREVGGLRGSSANSRYKTCLFHTKYISILFL